MTKTNPTENKRKNTLNSTAPSNNLLADGGTEKALQLAKTQLQVLMDITPMGVYLIDADFCISAVNPTALSVFGKIPDLIGRSFDKVIHRLWSKKYADEIVQLFRHTLETGEAYYTPGRFEERRDIGVNEDYEWWVNRITLADGSNGVICYFRDISTQVFARLALAKSEEKYRSLFDSTDQGFTIIETVQNTAGKIVDFRFREVNHAYEQLTGMQNVVGKLFSEVLPQIESYWMKKINHVLKTGEQTHIEDYNTDTKRWYRANYSRVGSAGSQLIGIVFDEITERKRREANLAFLVDLSEDLVKLTNIDETLQILSEKIGVHFSAAAAGFSEVDEKTGLGTPLQVWNRGDVIIPSDVFRIADYHSEKNQELMRSGKPEIVRNTATFPKAIADNIKALKIGAYVNMPLVRHGAWCITLSIIDSKARDWNENELALMSDLTTRIWTRIERARAEEALVKSQEQLQLALKAAELGTFIWYPQQDRTEHDARLLTILGMTDSSASRLVQSITTLIHPDDRKSYASAVANANDPNGNRKLDIDYRIIHPDGSLHWLHIFGQTFFSDENPPLAVRMHGVVFDITERKQAELEQRFQFEMEKQVELLTQQRNALMEINKTKDEFIAVASHQLRTPATAVKQYISILLDGYAGPVTAVQEGHLQTAYNSNERQLTVINDLLKTAQLDSTNYKLNIKSYDIVDLAKGGIAGLQSFFKMRNQTVVFKSSHKTIPIMIDSSDMNLVIVNLLENASKYSYPGAVLSVSIEKKAKSLLIMISDTGVGIKKKNQQRIFDKFIRVDNKLSDTVNGSGLGLYLVKQIVEKHGGTITLISQLEKGSTFTIELPL